jgi:hypothetical protein
VTDVHAYRYTVLHYVANASVVVVLHGVCAYDNSDWVKLNAGQHTLMRVAYTPKMIAALRGAIQSKVSTTALSQCVLLSRNNLLHEQ